MSYIEDIKAFADKQFEKHHVSEAIGFIYKGTYILDPWMDQTGRFPLSTQKAAQKTCSGSSKKHRSLPD